MLCACKFVFLFCLDLKFFHTCLVQTLATEIPIVLVRIDSIATLSLFRLVPVDCVRVRVPVWNTD